MHISRKYGYYCFLESIWVSARKTSFQADVISVFSKSENRIMEQKNLYSVSWSVTGCITQERGIFPFCIFPFYSNWIRQFRNDSPNLIRIWETQNRNTVFLTQYNSTYLQFWQVSSDCKPPVNIWSIIQLQLLWLFDGVVLSSRQCLWRTSNAAMKNSCASCCSYPRKESNSWVTNNSRKFWK